MSRLAKKLSKERRYRKGYYMPYHRCKCGRLTKNAICRYCKPKMLEIVRGRQKVIGDFIE